MKLELLGAKKTKGFDKRIKQQVITGNNEPDEEDKEEEEGK